MFAPCIPTADEARAVEIARIGFMSASPFYSHIFFRAMEEVLTREVPTAATDGRHVFINPTYLAGLKPPEAVFVYAHEVDHFVSRHPQRMKHYAAEGKLHGLAFDPKQFNVAADYVINAGLIEQGVGMCNPSWLFDPETTGEDLLEDVYERHFKAPPPGQGGGPGQTYGSSGRSPRGAQRDKTAEGQGGGFDSLLPPPVDPVTGAEDVPDESEFKEVIAAAAEAARAMGKLPESIRRRVEEILDPQIDWREHVRLLITGKIGARAETWNRPNRRRLVLNPLVIMPGRRGFGADTVVVGVDTSGSIGERELAAFFTEVSGVLADVRPKRVMLIFCDAKVHRVDEASSLDELAHIRAQGAPGGGGTSFIPVFDYLEEHDITPDTLIYITDLYGSFPDRAPGYPVIWCASTEQPVPWGDVVRIKI